MKKMGCVRSVFMGVVITCLLSLVMACGGGDDSGGAAGTTGTITIEASASSIPADGSSSVIISATIKDSAGNPVRHYTTVTFTTNLGRFMNGSTSFTMQTQPPLDEKGWPDRNAPPTGIAEATFMAGYSPGVAKVTVTSNNVTQSVYITLTGGSAGIMLTADPTSIPADGKSSSTITATLTDASGNPVKPGTEVTFTTGLGHFLSDSKSYTVSTADNTGIVKVALHAGIVPGTTYVVATSNEVSQGLQLVFTDTAASVMSISANPSVIPADGVSTSLVTATVKDTAGNGIGEVPITFYDANVPTQPSPLPDDNIWKGASSNSHVTPDFYCYSGNITFTVTYTGSLTSNFAVRLWNRDTLKVASLLINTTGPVTEEKVSRTVGAGNYYFQVDADGGWEIKVEGSIGPAQVDKPKVLAVTQTNSSGDAEYVYTSTLTAGIIKIRAETGELNVNESEEALTATVEITQTGLAPDAISVGATPAQIYANGENFTTIEATVTDKNGNKAADGTVVSFSATLGTIDATAETVDGIASATLTSTSSPTSVVSTVTAKVGTLSDSTTVTFVGVTLTDMQAVPATIFANGTDTSEISVRIRDANGLAVVGETITFTATLGSIQTETVATNSEGIAKTNLIAPTTAGTATITAKYGLITATTQVTFTDEPVVGNIVLTADPATIPADGTSSSTISATVTKGDGSAVPKGTSVTFTTNLGSFSNGSQTYTVVTPDATGVVSVALIAGTTTGSAEVIAISGGVSQSIYVGIGGASISITLTANPTSIPADGSSSSTITATLTDGSGQPVTPGTSVTFTTNLGTFSNGSTTITTSTIGENGQASVSLIAASTEGVATVTASSSGVSQSVTVGFTGGVAVIALTANPTTIPADGSSSSTITATLKDGTGGAVSPGTSVTFNTTLGRFSTGGTTITTATQDDSGVVAVSLISGTSPGTATVTCTSSGVSQSTTVAFSGEPADITVAASPSTLVADGSSTSTVTATVLDANGNPVPDGETLTVTVEAGTISKINPTTTDGVATVTYTAPSSVPTGNVDTVRFAASNGVSGDATISLTGPQVATVVLSSDPISIPANGTSTSTISATVTVQGGSPAPEGTSVTFTITTSVGGSFGGQPTTTKTTDANGVARATLTSGTSSGTEKIKAEAAGVSSDEISVTYQPGSITLTIVPNSLLATGTATAAVTAALKDVSGAPAPNGEIVNFALSDQTLGSLDATSATTSGGTGEASVNFTSGTKGGTVTITATWTTGGNDVTGTANITIQAPPAFIELVSGYPLPTKINIKGTGGVSTSELRFNVKDALGVLVASGYKIDFTILTGPNGGEDLIPSSTTTSDGQVITFLHSGFRAGPVSIKATYHDDTTINTTASQIVIVSGPPVGEAFGIAAQYINISGFWVAGLADPVTANAADIYGNAIPDNTAISFKTYNTGGYFATGTATTTQGRATDDLMSGGTYLRPLDGFLSITAEAVGGKSTHVTALEVAPGTNIVYAGTNGGGVYKSIDNGATWENISRSSENPKQGQNWIDPYIKGQSAISVDPDNTDVVYVGTGYLGRGNVYRSRDGGANWNNNDIEEWNGVYSGNSAVLTVLCDGGNSNYVWIGTEGEGAYYATDGETFTEAATGLTYGTSVREIVKDPFTYGNTAILYAATHTGIYRSPDGGITWTQPGTFAENNINTIAIHPANASVLYAGTENAGVWVSTNSGGVWNQYYPDGMGKGLSVSVPVADSGNTGNGSLPEVTIGPDTQSEFWAVTCTAAATNGGTFRVEGSVSGVQPNSATVGTTYTSTTGDISFTITDGTVDFAVGDFFTFTTIRDPGKTIKDLMVDEANDRLYAITYYLSPIEPYHAVGNVYVHTLNADGSMTNTDWDEANIGLPQFEPPNDTTLFAHYIMATDDETNPTYFLIGGDGINLYRATTGFNTGSPEWRVSKTGLTNLLMARMPILFSGNCTMSITETYDPVDDVYTYTIYIQDTNGNPPISGSTFTAITYAADDTIIAKLTEIEYPDTYKANGTFSDPADVTTDLPYTFDIAFAPLGVDHVTFTFIPINDTSTVPGSSGSKQEVSYTH
ncbi:MAG: invasin domain 3-containing protein [Deltaproteobacteria bacterium]|nr:invasin domain 3-containing protein [Deltaproteobacteria bacterium]